MKNSQKATTEPDGPAANCERCGATGARRIGNRTLCRECFQIAGSCCMEFGGDDFWKDADRQRTSP